MIYFLYTAVERLKPQMIKQILDFLKAITYGTQILAALLQDDSEADKIAAKAILMALHEGTIVNVKDMAVDGLTRLIVAIRNEPNA